MSTAGKYVAAVVTVIGGRVKAQADPRIAVKPAAASLALACSVAEGKQERREREAAS